LAKRRFWLAFHSSTFSACLQVGRFRFIIVVAAELAAGLLLVDEKRGRRIAIDRGLEVTGLLGVLAEARARGLIPQCQPILDEMIRVAGFWIGDDLRVRYLRGLNELD
jgi:predicted nucleic acid-binding protein